MEVENEKWIPLVDFSVQKGISLSTLRRYIKVNKIQWKLVEGRYLVKDDGTFTSPRNHNPQSHFLQNPKDTESRLKKLEQALGMANEEISELKMLVAFYEEKWAQNSKK